MANSSANQNRKKKMGKFKPKGRIANQAAINNVKAILPEILQRDMLIEYLHSIQDKFSHLSSDNLSALAFIMNLPLSEIWEVASFYDHFILSSRYSWRCKSTKTQRFTFCNFGCSHVIIPLNSVYTF